MRGGFRANAGRPRKGETMREVCAAAARAGMTPLAYMLAIMRGKTADPLLRDRMAIATAPYCHRRVNTTE